jgi:hemerythrin superfamily protein
MSSIVRTRAVPAAAQDHTHPLAFERQTGMAGRGKREAARGLDHHLHALGKKTHRFDQLRIGGGQDVVDVAPDDGERELAQVLGLRAVSQRLGCFDVDDLALAEGLLAVVAGFGLDAVELAVGRQRARRQRRATEQAAAAERHQQHIQRTGFLEQLARRRALPCEHVGVVVRRDHRQTALRREPGRERFAVLRVAIEQHDLAAIAARGIDLGLRRVERHEDRRRNAEQARGQRDRLRMIARRECDHARCALRGRELRQRVEGAAELERAHSLQVLALEIHLRVQQAIGGGGAQNRRAVRLALKAAGGGSDVVVSGELEHGATLAQPPLGRRRCSRGGADVFLQGREDPPAMIEASTHPPRRNDMPTTRSQKDACDLLDADHKAVKKLFKEYEEMTGSKARGIAQKKMELAQQICQELTVHAQIEEEIFYPAVREAIKDKDVIAEANVEHQSAKELIAQIRGMSEPDEMFDAKVKVLGEYIDHHVKEERGEIFPKARAARKLDLVGMRDELESRKEELMSEMTAAA